MPKERQILNRIQVVGSTQKITQAMKMVSIAKWEKTKRIASHLNRLTKPLEKILLQTLQASSAHNPYRHLFIPRIGNNILYVVLTAERGLCGSFNHIIFNKIVEEKYQTRSTARITFLPIGKKGHDFFKQKQYPYIDQYVDLLQNITMPEVQGLQNFLFNSFIQHTYDVIKLIYQPYSQGKEAQVVNILPLPTIKKDPTLPKDETIYEPNKRHIIHHLCKRLIALHLYEKIIKSQVAEHSARMIAMTQATDNATELLQKMRLQYNRMRQATITKGIVEIISGLLQY